MARQSAVADLLNQLNSSGLKDIASESDRTELISVDFVSDDADKGDDDFDLPLVPPSQDRPGPSSVTVSSLAETVRPLDLADAEPPEVHPIQTAEFLVAVATDGDVSTLDEPPFTCTCQYYDGKPCFQRFAPEDLLSARLQYLELSKQEHDVAVNSHLSSCMHRGATTDRSKHKEQSARERMRTQYFFGGHEVCHDCFCYVFGVGEKQLRNLIKHFKENGVCAGPIFFKKTRKCDPFGVNCEGLKKQVNFVLDESWDYGKGADTVISMLHFFFCQYGLGETEAHLHADNCCGQNKNNAMIQYLLWRVLTGEHEKITLSFMLAGHTKFACDWGFGLIKKLYRKTVVNCLQDVADVIEQSSVVNSHQLCATQDGNTIVPVYRWTEFLTAYFKRLPKIVTYHHFYFEGDSGDVRVQELIHTGEPIPVNILKANVLMDKNAFPTRRETKGLLNQRKWYLYKEIRPFVSPEHQDEVCPLPGEPESSSESETETEPQPKALKLGRGRGRGMMESGDAGVRGGMRWRGKGRGKKSS